MNRRPTPPDWPQAFCRDSEEPRTTPWTDDRPENNVWERQLLAALGTTCMTVETTRSAGAALVAERFDVIVSDIARQDNPREGLEAVELLRKVAHTTPILFYVGTPASSTPPLDSQGITDEPGELLHLILDQLERHRLPMLQER